MIQSLWYKIFPKDPVNTTQLSEAQWKNLIQFSKNCAKPLKDGDLVELLRVEQLNSVIELNDAPQVLMPNGEFENNLLKLSLIDSKPQEVLTVRLKEYGSDCLIDTKIMVYGGHDSVSFSEAEAKIRKINLRNIELIEISHTHPSYAVRVKTPQGNRLRFNELTPQDINVAHQFCYYLAPNKKVILRAIVPNGFSYNLGFNT